LFLVFVLTSQQPAYNG